MERSIRQIVISLAQHATAYTRSRAADSTNERIRIKAENDRAQQEILHLREEMRSKDRNHVHVHRTG
jgi:hypothetical protein